jgi:hypothetical protein
MEAPILRPRGKMPNRYRPLRRALADVLVLTLGTATGCKKKQTPGNGARSAAAETPICLRMCLDRKRCPARRC